MKYEAIFCTEDGKQYTSKDEMVYHFTSRMLGWTKRRRALLGEYFRAARFQGTLDRFDPKDRKHIELMLKDLTDFANFNIDIREPNNEST